MKVYRSITWNMETGQILAEDSFEYQGPVALCVAVAIGGAALAGVAGSAISGSEAKSGANAQAAAAQQAAELQHEQYEQTRSDQMPYMQAGQTALGTIGSDLANGTGFAKQFNLADYFNSPAYNFQLAQGNNAIQSSAAATGGSLNGGTLKALSQYTTGLANQNYGDAFNRYLENSQNQYSQLFNVAQLGENATASTGAQGTAAANNQGNYLTQAGNAQAAGSVAVGNAVNSGISSLTNGANTYATLAALQSASSYGNAPDAWMLGPGKQTMTSGGYI